MGLAAIVGIGALSEWRREIIGKDRYNTAQEISLLLLSMQDQNLEMMGHFYTRIPKGNETVKKGKKSKQQATKISDEEIDHLTNM